jgi:hypothetical protein
MPDQSNVIPLGHHESRAAPHTVAPEQFPQSVDGAVVLDEITGKIRRYIVVKEGVAEAIALWVVHTHCVNAFPNTPRLGITSPIKGCGKTVLLNVLNCLVSRPIMAANATAAGIYRSMEDGTRPTFFIDEGDTYLPGNSLLRCILNAGHAKHSAVLRADGMFQTFAPVAIAGIGPLPETIEDRSICIRLHRRRREEQVEKLRPEGVADHKRLGQMAARFAADHFHELSEAQPVIPSTLENREADNWHPLLAIAGAAGGDWPKRARELAERLTLANRCSEQSRAIMLLQDIRKAFNQMGREERLPSAELVKYLAELEDRPWREWNARKSITPNAIARILAPFDIKPFEMRIGARVVRGYERAQFEDVFARYLDASE